MAETTINIEAINIDKFISSSDKGFQKKVLRKLNFIIQNLKDMSIESAQQFEDLRARMDTATNNIAADIRNLAGQVASGMTAEETTVAVGKMEKIATDLEAIASITADAEEPTPTEGDGTPVVE